MAKKPETVFKERVLRDMKALPKTWVTKIQQVAKRGDPDILACVAGHFVALELKSGDRPAKGARRVSLQDWTLDQITTAGGMATKCWPEDWPEVLTALKTMAGCPSRSKNKHN